MLIFYLLLLHSLFTDSNSPYPLLKGISLSSYMSLTPMFRVKTQVLYVSWAFRIIAWIVALVFAAIFIPTSKERDCVVKANELNWFRFSIALIFGAFHFIDYIVYIQLKMKWGVIFGINTMISYLIFAGKDQILYLRFSSWIA